MENCERDDNGIIIDPITLEPIKQTNLISFKEGNKTFCYDINSLYLWNKDRNVPDNPLTRTPLDDVTLTKLINYAYVINHDQLFGNNHDIDLNDNYDSDEDNNLDHIDN